MKNEVAGIPFSSFLYAVFMGYLVFAIPAIVGFLLFDVIKKDGSLLVVVLLITIISIPITAAFSWLIARGSNWANTAGAITAACSVPARLYSSLCGLFIGFRFFGTAGGIIFTVFVYLAALAVSIPLAKFVVSRVVPQASSSTTFP